MQKLKIAPKRQKKLEINIKKTFTKEVFFHYMFNI